jgi:DNA-binding transcriptional ArsR family regulator
MLGKVGLTFSLAYGEREAVLNIEDPRYAKALRHPLRARILSALREGEATPTELAGQLGASVGTVAYHVRTLHGLGLIALTGETRVRGAVAHHYRAVPEAEPELTSATRATDGSPGATVSTLDPRVWPVAASGSFEDEHALAKLASLRLDATGWLELSRACAELLRQADLIARSAADRLAQNPQDADRDAGMALFMFEARQGNGEAVS